MNRPPYADAPGSVRMTLQGAAVDRYPHGYPHYNPEIRAGRPSLWRRVCLGQLDKSAVYQSRFSGRWNWVCMDCDRGGKGTSQPDCLAYLDEHQTYHCPRDRA